MPYKMRTYLFALVLILSAFLVGQNVNAQVGDVLMSATRATPVAGGTIGRGSTYGEWIGPYVLVPHSMNVCSVSFYLKRVGTRSDSVRVRAYNSPSGGGTGLLWSPPAILGSTISTSLTLYSFYDGSCFNRQGGEHIFFRIDATGANDTSNYYTTSQTVDSSPPTWFPSSAVSFRQISDFGTADDEVILGLVYGQDDLTIQEFTPTASDSWFSLSGAQTFCDNAFPIATGASASWFNLNLSNNLCLGFGFLFIPNGQLLTSGYASISDNLHERIPTSYFLQFNDLLQDSLSASTSSRFSLTYGTGLDIMGGQGTISFAPLSSTSVNYYMGSYMPTLRLVMEYILYIGFAFMWYEIGKRKFR